jgi:hypothetical protein
MKGWEHEEDKGKHEDELDRQNALKLPFVNSSACPNCYDEGLGEYDQEEMARFGMSDTNPYVMVFSCGSCDFSAIDEWQPHRHGLPDWFFQNTIRKGSDTYCWLEVTA